MPQVPPRLLRCAALLLLGAAPSTARATAPAAAVSAAPWVSDLGNGRYKNPVLHADYSDPDAIRVGEDYWMTASSFSHTPGLPILHSRDLVNWSLVGHALPRLAPEEVYRRPQHGKGVWAPAIRHHDGKFWIFFPDPDFGLFLVTASDPRGPWSKPVLVKGGRGLIDPCPLWDEDGKLYLIHGWAKSRANVNNAVSLLELSPDGASILDDHGFVINANKIPGYDILEGPKLYKREGWYYIFAPAGGVATGWQSVFRSRNIRGPYEERIVLAQGNTPINGPHQGALVDTPSGEEWFLHFQDKAAYGRIVHLQPVTWKDGWPLMGTGVENGAAKGEPVLSHAKPKLPPQPVAVPATSDEFGRQQLGLQWQWQANEGQGWYSLSARPGFLRLFAQPEPQPGNLYNAPHLLLQKFPAPEFSATTVLELSPGDADASAGLLVFGYNYAWIGLVREAGKTSLVLATLNEAVRGEAQQLLRIPSPTTGPVTLRVAVGEGGLCQFSYSTEGYKFQPVGPVFKASIARWVGAKFGLFACGSGQADFDWLHVESK